MTSKDNSYKQAVSQSKNILQCQSVSEVKSQISSEQFDSHYASEKDNAWPHLVGEKSAGTCIRYKIFLALTIGISICVVML